MGLILMAVRLHRVTASSTCMRHGAVLRWPYVSHCLIKCMHFLSSNSRKHHYFTFTYIAYFDSFSLRFHFCYFPFVPNFFVYVLVKKHGFVQSVDCTAQNVDLRFGQAILGLPTVCTIPELRNQCCGDRTIKVPAFEAECSSCSQD